MKKSVFILALAIGFAACNSEEKKIANPEMAHVALGFIQNMESLTDIKDPINAFIAGAESAAAESYRFNKDNAKLMMLKVKEFESAVIVVEDHTVVLANKNDECRESGSWGTCMYYVRGYIKKGQLEYHEDFLNNIIGTPDAQKRTIYFFKE